MNHLQTKPATLFNPAIALGAGQMTGHSGLGLLAVLKLLAFVVACVL
ncbi:hypothetical protein [Helicobacter sp. 11S02596-1]|nr:hypothetical protein [Helicobacter sp. 11S02596-1]